MKVQCCVCKKVREGGQWDYPAQALPSELEVSHGYCPECAAEAFAQLTAMPQRARRRVKGSSAA